MRSLTWCPPPHAAPGQVPELPSYSGRPPPGARGTARASRSSVARPRGRGAPAGFVSGSKGGTPRCPPGVGSRGKQVDVSPPCRALRRLGTGCPARILAPPLGLCSCTCCGGPEGHGDPCRPALGPKPQSSLEGCPPTPAWGQPSSDEGSGHAGRVSCPGSAPTSPEGSVRVFTPQ